VFLGGTFTNEKRFGDSQTHALNLKAELHCEPGPPRVGMSMPIANKHGILRNIIEQRKQGRDFPEGQEAGNVGHCRLRRMATHFD